MLSSLEQERGLQAIRERSIGQFETMLELAHGRDSPAVRQAATLMGIGPITASAVIATVGDFKQFKNGAQVGAWIGLTPRQYSSFGKSLLSGITSVKPTGC